MPIWGQMGEPIGQHQHIGSQQLSHTRNSHEQRNHLCKAGMSLDELSDLRFNDTDLLTQVLSCQRENLKSLRRLDHLAFQTVLRGTVRYFVFVVDCR